MKNKILSVISVWFIALYTINPDSAIEKILSLHFIISNA